MRDIDGEEHFISGILSKAGIADPSPASGCIQSLTGLCSNQSRGVGAAQSCGMTIIQVHCCMEEEKKETAISKTSRKIIEGFSGRRGRRGSERGVTTVGQFGR